MVKGCPDTFSPTGHIGTAPQWGYTAEPRPAAMTPPSISRSAVFAPLLGSSAARRRAAEGQAWHDTTQGGTTPRTPQSVRGFGSFLAEGLESYAEVAHIDGDFAQRVWLVRRGDVVFRSARAAKARGREWPG